MSARQPHARTQPRLSRRHQRYLYLTSALLLISGAGWLLGRYLLRTSGAFGDVPHPSEVWWLRLHGAMAMAFLVVFGALMPVHIVQNWQRRVNRYTGLAVLVVVGLLVLSGYGLYYIAEDKPRAVASVLHWVIGLAASGALALHVLIGKRLAVRARATSAAGAWPPE
jgi:cation transport ATPase